MPPWAGPRAVTQFLAAAVAAATSDCAGGPAGRCDIRALGEEESVLLQLGAAARTARETSDVVADAINLERRASSRGGSSALLVRTPPVRGVNSSAELDGAELQPTKRMVSGGVAQPLGGSTVRILAGAAIILSSAVALWFNETEDARWRALLYRARRRYKPVTACKSFEANRGRLVFVNFGRMTPAASVRDGQFDVALGSGCVRLRSEVRVCQWLEYGREDKHGGSSFGYRLEWSDSYHDSSAFEDPRGHENPPTVPGLSFGTFTTDCERVEYGDGFLLPLGLVRQCEGFRPTEGTLPRTVALSAGGLVFASRSGNEGVYYCRPAESPGAAADAVSVQDIINSPQPGDLRVRFDYVPAGPATVLALQAENDGEEKRDTFLPYRVIPTGLLESAESERARLLAEGRKSRGEIAEEAASCCCLRNCPNVCMANGRSVEIFHLLEGKQDLRKCFETLSSNGVAGIWQCRAVGWLLLFFGTYLALSPAIGLFMPILLLSLVVMLLLVALVALAANFAYHPLTVTAGVVSVAGAVGLVSIVHALL